MSKYVQIVVAEICAIIAFLFFNANGILPLYTIAETTILNILLLGALIRSAFILMQCILFENAMTEMIKILEELEYLFKHCLHHRICYCEFIKTYRQRIYLLFSLFLLHFFMFFLRVVFQDIIHATVFLIRTMTVFNYLHAILFIDLTAFNLKQLNLVVNNDMLADDSEIPIRNHLKYFKIAYSRVWMINQRVNRYFGYGFIPLLLNSFADIVYSAFWEYQLIQRYLGLGASFMSKYARK